MGVKAPRPGKGLVRVSLTPTPPFPQLYLETDLNIGGGDHVGPQPIVIQRHEDAGKADQRVRKGGLEPKRQVDDVRMKLAGSRSWYSGCP